MSLQHIFEAPELNFTKDLKGRSDESPSYQGLLPTRSNTPENNSLEKVGSDNESVVESLTPTIRMLSVSSFNSMDMPDQRQFEIDVCPKRKRFNNLEERRLFVEEYKRKYKTEMCKNWELRGNCKFGDKCCFAHGRHELKSKVLTHIKYKTKPCKQYHQTGYCPYGQRCQYLHKEAIQPNVFFNPAEGPFKATTQIYDVLYEVNRLCNTDVDLKTVLDKLPKRSRLSVFQKTATA
jgi:hypothetical protein